MPSDNSYLTTQGEAWDQIALSRLGKETHMDALLPENVEEMDALLLSGGLLVALPLPGARPRKRRPAPWERL